MSKDRPPIVCLCGSSRFAAEYQEANFQETLAGYIVLTIGCNFNDPRDQLRLTPEDKERLDKLHLKKVELADEVFILNVGGYIGESTKRELEYAKQLGKKIRFWHNSDILEAAYNDPNVTSYVREGVNYKITLVDPPTAS